MDWIIDFLSTPAGQILIRTLCVLFIGIGIFAITKSIGDRKVADKSQKAKSKMEINVHILAYSLNIAFSVLVSYRYDRRELPLEDLITDGILYGIGSVGLQFLLTSGAFLNFIKVWRKA